MGKDLQGNDLGKGICQRKDGRYCYRYQLDCQPNYFYSRDLDYLKLIRDSGFNSNVAKNYYFEIFDKTLHRNCSRMEEKISSILPKKQYVYFISDGEFVKIGVTHNVIARLKQMQTGNSRRLKLIRSIESHAPYLIECALHEILKRRRVNGEWYDILDLLKEREV